MGQVSRIPLLPCLLAICLALLAGCNRTDQAAQEDKPSASRTEPPKERLRIEKIELGRSIGMDKRVTEATTAFAPLDYVYVSIVTAGKPTDGTDTLTARWNFGDGQLVSESSQTLPAEAEGAVTEFHISKPDGLPEGSYRVEVLINGRPAGSKGFKVVPSGNA